LKAPKDEMELIRPAVEGTMAVLRSAHKYRAQRVVVTSSVASVMVLPRGSTKDTPFTEADWSDVATCGAYEKSKTMAEKAAWDF
jgi:dihydroflavonol-4-reductase